MAQGNKGQRGGAQPGAGRPKGVADNLKLRKAHKYAMDTRQIIENTMPHIPKEIRDMTPLQVMLTAMGIRAYEGKWNEAAAIAKEVAPYLHPRLSSVDLNANVRRSIEDYSDAELAALAGAIEYTDGVDAKD